MLGKHASPLTTKPTTLRRLPVRFSGSRLNGKEGGGNRFHGERSGEKETETIGEEADTESDVERESLGKIGPEWSVVYPSPSQNPPKHCQPAGG
ncbi:MAG: hypothetical protein AAGJ83_13635 [Planctomycetota bacterium]